MAAGEHRRVVFGGDSGLMSYDQAQRRPYFDARAFAERFIEELAAQDVLFGEPFSIVDGPLEDVVQAAIAAIASGNAEREA